MMSQHTQLSQTNGASLEDCHTNFFTLTDLCGIKWRVYAWESTSAGGTSNILDPLEDPVLVSYARCLSADVLCVWRRSWRRPSPSVDALPGEGTPQCTHQPPRPPNCTGLKYAAKELWVFWYGDEPDLSNLVSPELSKSDGIRGSWDWETGLSYECRTILFKALHNLIERCLLREDFVRLGKWFVQPFERGYQTAAKKITHLAFSLSFFVHGESTVCASVDVREQPPVRRLRPLHLTMAASIAASVSAAQQHLRNSSNNNNTSSNSSNNNNNNNNNSSNSSTSCPGLPVLLSPFSLNATLTGISFRATDPGISKILDEWKQFFPMPGRRKSRKKRTRSSSSSSEGEDGDNTRDRPSSACARDDSGPDDPEDMPPVVEVLLGGFKLKYPSYYVLVTDLDEQTVPKRATPYGTRADQLAGDPTCDNTGNPPVPRVPSARDSVSSTGNYLEDSPHHTHSPFIASSHPLMHPEYLRCAGRGLGASRNLADRVWEDLIQCHNSHHQDTSLSAAANATVPPAADGPLSVAEIAGHWDFADPAAKVPCNCAKCLSGGSLYKGGVPTPGSVPGVRPAGCGGSGAGLTDGPPASVESQTSITPSPLATPHSHQTSATPHHEPTMPTLSPQPPHSNASACDPATPGPGDHHPGSVDVKPSLTELTNSAAGGVLGKLPFGGQSLSPYTSLGSYGHHPASNVGGSSTVTTSTGASHTANQHCLGHGLRGLKRPILPGSDVSDYADAEQHTAALYDSAVLDAWYNQPVKRFRPTVPKAETPYWPPYRPPHHLTAVVKHECTTDSNGSLSSGIPTINGLPSNCKKLLCSSPSKLSSGLVKRPVKTSDDVYLFDDDLVNMNGLTDGFKKEFEIKKEPEDSSTSPSRNEIFGTDLMQPSFELDKMFPCDDSPANDTNYHEHTPPGSNISLCHGDEGLHSNNKSLGSTMGGLSGNSCINNNSKLSGGSTAGTVSLGELAKMYPTPPSHEPSANDHEPPCEDMTVGGVGASLQSCNAAVGGALSVSCSSLHVVKTEPLEEHPRCGSPFLYYSSHRPVPPTPLDQKGPNIYWPPSMAMFVGSEKYQPLLDLPSAKDPIVILPNSVYKPSWQLNNNSNNNNSNSSGSNSSNNSNSSNSNSIGLNNNNNTNNNNTPHSNIADKLPRTPSSSHLGSCLSHSQQAAKLGSISPAIDRGGGPGSVGGPSSVGTNIGYELPSPASNQSYLSKAVASVEPCTGTSVPEANALVLNMVLMDSSLNLFRDHNFNSSTMCVCNNDQKVVGNVRGSDGALYLPVSHLSPSEEHITCNCGFSAVVNRRLAFQSGLFYEDEVDLTGLHDELRVERKKPSLSLLFDNNRSNGDLNTDTSVLDDIPESLFKLLQDQCVDTLGSKSSVVQRAADAYRCRQPQLRLNLVDLNDGNELVHYALDQALYDDSAPSRGTCLMHKWSYIQFNGPSCSQDLVRCMNALQPFLEEAIQKKRSSRPWQPVFNVRGPLTWRHFHRMAVRGTEDMAEPLPVPMLLAGHEREWVSVAPQTIRHWERFMLEPYSQQRNIGYVVVSPDNEFVLTHVRMFFKELSSVYELCRLGRHAPIQRALRDGIMRVGKTAAAKVANESLDDWFSTLDTSQISTKLKFYSQVCRHRLAPHLLTLSLDKTLFEVCNSRTSITEQQQRQASMSPMPPPSLGPDSGAVTNNGGISVVAGVDGQQIGDGYLTSASGPPYGAGCTMVEQEEDEGPPPAIMVYLVDPFSVGRDHPEQHRFITLGLLRCYKQMLDCLPPQKQAHVHLQIISLESILELVADNHQSSRQADQLKCLAFSVFTQCRRYLTHASSVRSLTGFGPASVYDSFLKPNDPNEDEKLNPPFPVYSPPFILASNKENKHKEVEEALGVPREKSTVLYCTYCLSEDQRWLLAAVTDNHGEMLQTITINVEVPNRTRRKKASSRRPGLKKLMEWILSVMSTGVHPWRLVIGKLGRMGHGELKGWLHLLSRKSLVHSSKNLKDLCKQCDYLYPSAAPCILSACLVSLEPDSSFRMLPDIFTPDERFGQTNQNCNLNTPQDITATHILVFPTSATAQSTQQRLLDDPPFQFINDDDPLLLDENIEDFGSGMDMGMGGFNYLDFVDMDAGGGNEPDPMDDGHVGQQESLSQPASPSGTGFGGAEGRFRSSSPSLNNGQALSNGKVMADPNEDDMAALQQQPLALGYYISTASTGNLPQWFWSSCPHLENVCPVFLKSALHLNQPAVTQAEDVLPNTSTKAHPLDSNCTADVLRFVLEGYNGLSWLVLDPSTQDRKSCLPIHIQTLSNLYNAMAALV